MSGSNSRAELDQDQAKEAPQGRGILLGFCYHPDQDNRDKYAVFGTLDMKGQLVPVMRHGYRVGDDLQLCHTNLNTIIDFSIITFERHLVCFNRDVGALTEYCRICIRHVNQKVPLSSLVAVEQTKRAMATKRLGEIERHTSPLFNEDGQAYARGVEDVKGPVPRTDLETQHSSSASTSSAMSKCMLDQLTERAAEELGWKLSSARSYVGIQTEGRYKTIGALLPMATSDVLEQWIDFFRRNGCVEEDIKNAGYGMDASAYVKLPLS